VVTPRQFPFWEIELVQDRKQVPDVGIRKGDGAMAQEKFAEKSGDAMKKAGQSMKDAAGKVSANAAALNSKVIDQAEENTRAAFVALRSAASVKSVQELAKIQGDFMKEAAARSQTQIKEVGEMIAQFGKDAMTMFQPKKD
jgi:hypothetical protein